MSKTLTYIGETPLADLVDTSQVMSWETFALLLTTLASHDTAYLKAGSSYRAWQCRLEYMAAYKWADDNASMDRDGRAELALGGLEAVYRDNNNNEQGIPTRLAECHDYYLSLLEKGDPPEEAWHMSIGDLLQWALTCFYTPIADDEEMLHAA